MGGSALGEGDGADGEDGFVVRLKDGTLYLEVVSGLQKMIRRGMEEEALVLALGLYDSGYGMALAKRIPVISGEDIGLADPAAVAQACTFCTTWITLKKESKFQPDGLLLALAVVLLSRAEKNREIDNSCVVIREEQKRGTGWTVKDVIERNFELIVDSHTAAGRTRLKKIAAERGIPDSQMFWQDFLQVGAVVEPLREIRGDPWSHRAYSLFGLDYDEVKKGKKL